MKRDRPEDLFFDYVTIKLAYTNHTLWYCCGPTNLVQAQNSKVHSPECIEYVEGIVESGFLWEVLQREERGIAEPEPAEDTQRYQAVACR